jgi:methyltransferase (TIGR00027 family)
MTSHRPSHTAVKIGKGQVFLAQDPQIARFLPEGSVELSERLMTSVGLLKGWERSLFGSVWFQKISAFIERHTMPGASLHVALRKRFMDDETRAAIRDGAKQVLVVGAGFDTLSVRLAGRFPEVLFVEVDQPGTHEVKRRAVGALDAHHSNFQLLGVDLASTSLEEALSFVGPWQRDRESVVIAEGVLMYLEESAVAAFLEAIHSLTGAGSRLLFTYMRRDEAGRIYGGKLGSITRLSLKMIGEPWCWGAGEGMLPDFLAKRGFQLTAPERCDLRSRYLEPAGLADRQLGDVERVAIARSFPHPTLSHRARGGIN